MDDMQLLNSVRCLIGTWLYQVDMPPKDADVNRVASKIFRLVRDVKPAPAVGSVTRDDKALQAGPANARDLNQQPLERTHDP